MKFLKLLLLIILILFFSACQNSDLPALTPSLHSSDTSIPPSPTETALPPSATVTQPPAIITATPPPPPALDLASQYVISATLDYGWRFLTVEQEIRYPNTASEVISELTLVVQPNWRPNVFKLTRFTWDDGTPVEDYTLDIIQLRVPLPEPLQPGETLEIALAYELQLPPILTSEDWGPNPFGYTSRQINLTDWYPFVPPYIEGEGWLVHNPWYYGEHLVYPMADFEVSIQISNAPSGTLIAASALDESQGDLHQYRLEKARNFVWSVSPEYRVFQDQVGDVRVFGYAFPYDVTAGEAAFKVTVKSLELYQELFGPYPFDAMTMVQADFDHGMEYSGLYFLSKAFYNTYDGTASTYLVAIAAHETAHQWWYGLVGNDQALEPWLDEALCTYTEKLFYENLYPDSLDWWWDVRVYWYEPAGWVDSTIYNTAGYRPYRDAVYLNGAIFLDELRTLVGDEAFFAFLKDYVRRETNQLDTAEDFFSILREHSAAEWRSLLEKYFENPDISE